MLSTVGASLRLRCLRLGSVWVLVWEMPAKANSHAEDRAAGLFRLLLEWWQDGVGRCARDALQGICQRVLRVL